MSQDNSNLTENKEIPKGYKKTEIGFTPKEWELVKLGDISEVKMCKRVLSHQTKKNGVIPFFKIGTFGTQADSYISKSLYDEYRAKYSFPESGDILVSAAGTLGKTVVYDGKPSYFQDSNIVWLKVDKSKVINEYLYHYYKVIKWASTEGTTIARLYNGIIYDTQILLPSINEQKTIAVALSGTDALISELEKLIEKKQAIKTATMQQLLTGKTRLPEFAFREDGTAKGYKDNDLGQIPEDWVALSIGSDTSLKARIGWQALTTAEYLKEGNYYLVTGIDFNGGLVNWDSCCYVSEWRYKQDKNIKLQEHDVLVTKDGTIGKVGFIESLPLPATLNSGVFVVRPKLTKCLPRLLFYILTSSCFDDFVKLITAGSTIVHLYQKDFVNFNFYVPHNIEEQSAIANILADLDAEFAKLNLKLAKLKNIKQGMMQELLTGKTRLV